MCAQKKRERKDTHCEKKSVCEEDKQEKIEKR